MKIGIYGGSFNPIHMGHLNIIFQGIKLLNLDKLIIIPVGIPSHKGTLIKNEDRFNMCQLGINSSESREIIKKIGFKDDEESILRKIEVSRIEIENEKTSYTYDTLVKLKNIYLNSEFYEIIGEDSAKNIETWKDYEKLLMESNVIVFKRCENGGKNIEKKRKTMELELIKKFKMKVLNTPYYSYSSSDIRERLENNQSINGLVPDIIESYLKNLKN